MDAPPAAGAGQRGIVVTVKRSDDDSYIQQFVLGPKGRVRIGRDPTNEVCLEHRSVSKFHAELQIKSKAESRSRQKESEPKAARSRQLYLTDLSQNGTAFVVSDGTRRRITRGKDHELPKGVVKVAFPEVIKSHDAPRIILVVTQTLIDGDGLLPEGDATAVNVNGNTSKRLASSAELPPRAESPKLAKQISSLQQVAGAGDVDRPVSALPRPANAVPELDIDKVAVSGHPIRNSASQKAASQPPGAHIEGDRVADIAMEANDRSVHARDAKAKSKKEKDGHSRAVDDRHVAKTADKKEKKAKAKESDRRKKNSKRAKHGRGGVSPCSSSGRSTGRTTDAAKLLKGTLPVAQVGALIRSGVTKRTAAALASKEEPARLAPAEPPSNASAPSAAGFGAAADGKRSTWVPSSSSKAANSSGAPPASSPMTQQQWAGVPPFMPGGPGPGFPAGSAPWQWQGGGAWPGQMSPEQAENQLRQQIYYMYQRFNPPKLKDFEWLMDKYKGNEQKLLMALWEKYVANGTMPMDAPDERRRESIAAEASDPPERTHRGRGRIVYHG